MSESTSSRRLRRDRGGLLSATLQLLGRRAWDESRLARAIPALGRTEAA